MPNNPSSTQVNDDLTLPFDISAANSTPTRTRIPSIRAENVIKRRLAARQCGSVDHRTRIKEGLHEAVQELHRPAAARPLLGP
jgi:hypothetical protein